LIVHRRLPYNQFSLHRNIQLDTSIFMSEARTNSRINVVWRAAIQVAPGKIVPAKIINFSMGGVLLQCGHLLKDGQTYQMMMEVPEHRDASHRTQVVCKATCTYTILSGNEYRAGMRYFDIPSQHEALIASWGGSAPKVVE
jgi:PilZ domain